MSTTPTDFAKVTQMLDSGWTVSIRKNKMDTYTAVGWHPNGRVRDRIAEKLKADHDEVWAEEKEPLQYDRSLDWSDNDRLYTDDFTPEQALTRLAYKVHGEVL